MKKFDNKSLELGLIQAATESTRVKGMTHDFYRYPARFSPIFINKVIQYFTNPGDLVLDPFVGGGTTAVEARILGRRAVGVDINSLSTFVSKVKTTPLGNTDTAALGLWIEKIPKHLNLKNRANFSDDWREYYRNIDTKETWPIKKAIQLALDSIGSLTPKQQKFVRCGLLRTSQWAFDSRKIIPTIGQFRNQLSVDFEAMLNGIREYSKAARIADSKWNAQSLPRTTILNRNVIGIENDTTLLKLEAPKLILTSPPYPGVHVLYHRWQVNGRRETPAPYWIANMLDGSGESYYTFGSRKENGLTDYFKNTYQTFKSLSSVINSETTVVQLIAFSEPDWQLPLYLETLDQAGFIELQSKDLTNSNDGRLWRQVPNRKWHASIKGSTSSSNEVVLIHKLK